MTMKANYNEKLVEAFQKMSDEQKAEFYKPADAQSYEELQKRLQSAFCSSTPAPEKTTIEGWVAIQDFPSYMINRSGDILSTLTNKVLKPAKHKSGYVLVSLRKEGKSYTQKLHRLIAKAFIPNPENKPFIDHINGIRDDNRIENLRWCTNQENVSFPLAVENNRKARIGIPQSKNTIAKRTEVFQEKYGKKIAQYSIDGELIGTYKSINEAARVYKIKPTTISLCCQGINQNAGGFIWRFYTITPCEKIDVVKSLHHNRKLCMNCGNSQLINNSLWCKIKDCKALYYACHKYKDT